MPSAFTFTDTKGRIWDLHLTIAGGRRIENSTYEGLYDKKFSFNQPDKELFSALLSNPAFMCAVIWALVQPQVKQYFLSSEFHFGPSIPTVEGEGIVDKQRETAWPSYIKDHYDQAEMEFVESIDGAALESAREAFWRSLADFFRDQKTVLDLLERQHKKLRAKINKTVENLEMDFEEGLDAAMEQDVKELREKLKNPKTLRESPTVTS